MPNVGPMEILLLIGFALLLFGPKRLPEIGNKLGRGMREFKDSVAGVKDDFEPALEPFHAPEDEQKALVDHDAA
jgi:sec-independent protein translocase protein TatA